MPRPKVTFHVVRADGGPAVLVEMRGDIITCGKQGDLALHQDPFVAPTQARFFFSNSQLAVEDVGGGNGIFLRLRTDHPLAPGSELRLGRQRLLLEPIAPLKPSPDGTLIWGSPDPGSRYRLVQLLEGGSRGAAFLLKEGDNFIGREGGEITFPSDGYVSSRHALIRVLGNQLWVRDLGSSNGTFLRLSAPTLVESGDHFLIGRELFRVDVQPA
jgi:pSer/pThr/pTyr-binding forkhead associated (FHA) protein